MKSEITKKNEKEPDISPFVPLRHVRNGIFGIQGHVVAFEQDIEGFLKKIPRKKDDVTILKVIQTVRAEIRGEASSLKEFKVRKAKVLETLDFLRNHSDVYKDIEIDDTVRVRPYFIKSNDMLCSFKTEL